MTDADVVVGGAGIAGLTVAHDLATAGARVVVCEASDRAGGLLRRGTVGGIDIDLGAESFATRTDAVTRLISDARLGLDPVEPRAGGAFLAVAGEGAGGVRRAALPRRTVLGIPADPLAGDVVALIGAEAAERSAAEASLPPYVPGEGDEPSLRTLVAERLGPVVADRLVDTLCRSVYSRPAADVRLSDLHPGMWRALGVHGSLLAAAGELAPTSRAGAAVGGIAGGMWWLPDALARAAARRGVDLRMGVAVTSIDADADGLRVRTSAGDLRAARVVIALSPAAAAALSGAPAPAAGGRVRVVAAAIDHDGLDAFPVGSGVIVDPALPSAAKALTHVTAKWPWMPVPTGPTGAHRHVVRLSARDADAGGLETPADIAREVALLTGIPLTAADVVDVVVQDWPDAVAPPADGRAAAADDAPGIHRVGAAVAGTGLASVIPHARALAARLAAELSPTSSESTAAHPTRSLA